MHTQLHRGHAMYTGPNQPGKLWKDLEFDENIYLGVEIWL